MIALIYIFFSNKNGWDATTIRGIVRSKIYFCKKRKKTKDQNPWIIDVPKYGLLLRKCRNIFSSFEDTTHKSIHLLINY
jgi:hypothetical protein